MVTDPQTNTATNPQTQTGPITIHCAAKLSTQCNNIIVTFSYLKVLIKQLI